jgi:hypothetical protein
MTELEVHVVDRDIIVTLPGTRYTITFQMAPDLPTLIEKPEWTRGMMKLQYLSPCFERRLGFPPATKRESSAGSCEGGAQVNPHPALGGLLWGRTKTGQESPARKQTRLHRHWFPTDHGGLFDGLLLGFDSIASTNASLHEANHSQLNCANLRLCQGRRPSRCGFWRRAFFRAALGLVA